ncbi:hypothetical protein FRC09_016221 [Ceratobasidium sp. 395]|nr:hypothetical protein FRC09_016221 [Ceratobasidium sp. 395]
MRQVTSKIKQNVKKPFKKLFDRPPNGQEPSTTPGLQGPGTQSIDVTRPQPALESTTPLQLPLTTPSPHPESSGTTQPSAPVPSVPPITEQGAAHDGWLGLKAFTRIVSEGSELLAPLKPAIDGISEAIGTFELAAQNREDYKRLRTELNAMLHDLAGYFGSSTPLAMTSTVINLAQ